MQAHKTLAENKNHEITVIIDESDAELSAGKLAEKLKGVNAAIDFSSAEAVKRNVKACLLANVPLVEGTTGWNGEKENIKKLVEEKNGAFVFGANFSIGVNLFYKITNYASELSPSLKLRGVHRNSIIRAKRMPGGRL